jgi:hypothetical protein
MAELGQRIDKVEGEVKLLNNEVKSVLLDIREHVLTYYQNPFSNIDSLSKRRPKRSDESIELMERLEDLEDREEERREKESPAPNQELPSSTPTSPTAPLPQENVGGMGGSMPPGGMVGGQQTPLPSYQGPAQRQAPIQEPAGGGAGYQEPPSDSMLPTSNAEHYDGIRRVAGKPTYSREREGNGYREGTPIPEQELLSSTPSPSKLDQEEQEEKIEIATIAGLAKWVRISVRKIGREKVEGVLEIYEMAGHLSPNIKEILLKLIHLSDEDGPGGKVSMNDCVTTLIQLDAILGQEQKGNTALLSMLFEEEETSSWIKP